MKIYFPIILLFCGLTGQSVLASESIFVESESPACGISECEVIEIFGSCKNAEYCGEKLSSSDCGNHWTAWHSVGGGHGNPCPSDCVRIGGSIGISYRSVGFPPKLQEQNKYLCQRNILEANECQNPLCDVISRSNTGKELAYARCEHPAHGLSEEYLDGRTRVDKSSYSSELIEVIDRIAAMSNLSKGLSVDERNTEFDRVGSLIATLIRQENENSDLPVAIWTQIALGLQYGEQDFSKSELRAILGESRFLEMEDKDGYSDISCL